MQIKQQMLAQQVQRKLHPLYILIGQDNYLLDESLRTIKTAIKKNHDCDEKVMSIQSVDDWRVIAEEANSYSLFSDTVLLNIFYDKKTLDAAGKKILTEYLKEVNTRCFIIIRAPNLPGKQIQWLNTEEQALVSIAYPLTAANMQGWIAQQLRNNTFSFSNDIPELIYQYTQGNMLACAQVIEKLSLANPQNHNLNINEVKEHLSNQCEHNLFELIDACLQGKGDKAIQILRHTASNKTEATLVLWMLSQEVRALIQLQHLSQQMDFKSACGELKIWPMRISLYQACQQRFKKDSLQQLHQYCNAIDERIKSSFNSQVWNSLENLALSLCLGRLIGDVCNV